MNLHGSHIAVIPARGGSKRLPNKNIMPLDGIPLIAWTIRAAQESGVFAHVIVSTDSPEIADIARREGAEVPGLRPAELASDGASSTDVAVHALTGLHWQPGASLCLLQPTSPLRQAGHIREALQLMQQHAADNVVSVCPCEHSPLWANTLPASGSLAGFIRPEYRLRSQDLPQFYRLNGAIYWVNIEKFMQEKRFVMEERSYAYIMGTDVSIDIDRQVDFDYCELLVQREKSCLSANN